MKKRLRIEALNMQDEEENDLPLTEDEENDRLKFEELHLKLTPSHIKVLKSKGFSEVVYEYENGELVIQLDELANEIDVTPFERPTRTQYVEPEDQNNDEIQIVEDESDEIPVDDEDQDELELIEAQNEDETVLEAVGVEMTPNMKSVSLYEFVFNQLTDENSARRPPWRGRKRCIRIASTRMPLTASATPRTTSATRC